MNSETMLEKQVGQRLERLITKLTMLATLASACVVGTSIAQTSPGPGSRLSVRYQGSIEGMQTLPILNALTKDYFSAEGLDLVYQPLLLNASLLTTNLLNGGTDITLTGGFGNMTAIQTGIPIISIGVVTATPNQALVLTNQTVAELKSKGITLQSPLADRIKALKGMSLSVFGAGSTSYQIMTGLLRTNGINPDVDMTIQGINDAPSVYNAAKQGKVNGFFLGDPSASKAVTEGFGTIWVSVATGDVPALVGVPFTELATTPAYIKNNGEAVRRFMRAVWRGITDLQQNGKDPATRAAIKAKYFVALDDATYNRAFDNALSTIKDVPVPTPEAFARSVAFYNVSAKLPFTKTFADLYDTGPVKAAKP